MSPLRGSLMGANRILQRCRPYGVETESKDFGEGQSSVLQR